MRPAAGLRGGIARAVALGLLALLLHACGGGGGSDNDLRRNQNPPAAQPPAPDDSVVGTTAYVPGAPHAGALRTCTYAGSATEQCTLDELPFLGMEAADPTIADVMARTLVSHSWMGANFEDVLALLPADVLPLFRSITAVVIASDIRPAHYDPDTGAIYLDPDFLWLTVAERNTVSTDPDPRSGFGLDLQFQMPWRYVRDNQRMTVFLNADGSRDLGQIDEIMAFLLYHELAHAVDFMPPDRMAGLAPTLTVPAALARQSRLSDDFQLALPLNSTLLKQLAGVSFLGDDSTAAQRALQPVDLVGEFLGDGAVQYYAYTSQFEDFAVLFESAMMKWRYGYDKDTAITDFPASGGTDAAIVAWGTRGRLGEQPVYQRVLDVAERIYPADLAEFQAFLEAEPEPLRMREGETWGQNLILDPVAATSATAAGHGIDKSGRRADYFLERVRIR